MKIPDDLSVETQKKLCEHHINHFKRLIELGKSDKPAARTVRMVECESYLATWQAGAAALAAGHAMPFDCVQEMQDAVDSGDMDGMLTAEELQKLQAYLEAQS